MTSFHEVLSASVGSSASSVSRKSIRQKRKVAHAEVITSSPYKQALETSQQSKKAKMQKKEKKDSTKTSKKTPKTKKAKSKETKKKTSSLTQVPDEDENCRCLYCQELYCESIDAWIKCRVCHQWAHDLCAGKEDGSIDFVCEICLG